MKHLIVTLLVTFVAASAVAQGTVAFANTSGTKLIDGSTGGPPETADYTIGLYWAAGSDQAADALALADGGTTVNRIAPSFAKGLFNGGDPFAIAGADETAPITVEVRVWDTASGGWDNALMAGRSGVLNVTTGGGAAAAPALFGEGLLQSITITAVPEPTSFALAGLGAAALLAYRRRK